jgi:NAD+ kinase
VVAAVGGDGSLIYAIHRFHHLGKPFVGINGGSLGFLSAVKTEDIERNLSRFHLSDPVEIRPFLLQFEGRTELAVQDLRIERPTHRSIRMKIEMDGKVLAERHIGDGIIIANSVGSTGYSLSAGGRVLPIRSQEAVLTPISPFLGEIYDSIPTSVTADFKEVVITTENEVRVVADNREYYLPRTVVRITRAERGFRLYVAEACHER